MAVFTFLMTLIFVAVLLRSRRPPASTIAWLGAVILIPYIGVPLFLMFGVRKIRIQKRSLTSSEVAQFKRIKPNTEITFLTTGEEALKCLLRNIREARESIDLSTFILSKDETGRQVLQELTAQAARGVRVRLLLDSFGSSFLVRPSLKEFRLAGGKVAFFMPLLHLPFRGQANLRNHRKIAVFDQKATWFGGMNIAKEYLGPAEPNLRWTDLSISLQGESVGDLQHIFDADWAFATKSDEKNRPTVTTPHSPNESALAQVVPSGPDTSLDSIYESLLNECYRAQSRIWITTPYFIPDESLIKALELAGRRGVDVRVLLPRKSNHFFADLSRTTYLRQLIEAGGRAFFYPKMMHAKVVTFDDQVCLVGSANFDLRSLLYNFEIGVLLTSAKEIQTAIAFQEGLFEKSQSEMPKRSLFRDLIEGLGRIFGQLL